MSGGGGGIIIILRQQLLDTFKLESIQASMTQNLSARRVEYVQQVLAKPVTAISEAEFSYLLQTLDVLHESLIDEDLCI